LPFADNGLPEKDDDIDMEPEKKTEVDARVLPIVRNKQGVRQRNFSEAVPELTESEWDSWPITGPRTTSWCVAFIKDQNGAPRARHARWKSDCKLKTDDSGVLDHELALRAMELAVCYDQLNISELASFELLARRAQLAEIKHKQALVEYSVGSSGHEDEHLYLGTSETRGLLMVAPELETFVASELTKEAAVMKEKRKLREEKVLIASGATAKGGAGGKTKG